MKTSLFVCFVLFVVPCSAAAPEFGQPLTDAELFANLDLDAPSLAAVKQAVAAKDLPAAKTELAAYLRGRTSPLWQFDGRHPAFQESKKKPNRRNLATAEKVLEHKFDYSKGPGQTGTIDFGAKIDWTANPTAGEARTHLWNESLNRHFHFRTLADAYWQSGDDRYAKEIADEILDWTRSNPPVTNRSGNSMPNGCEAWQTLTTGIRLADTWPTAYYHCRGSKAFSDEALAAMLKSVCQQARHLIRWPSHGNWLTAESNGLFTAGVLFPEFREAAEWRRIAVERLYRQLDEEVYPEGMQFELAAGYNNWVVKEFADIVELAEMNGRRKELPADFQAKMEKMFDYLLRASMPNGQIPGLNDANNSDVRKLLETGYKLYPQREDFRFVATGGGSGSPPRDTSCGMPYCGHYVMRSGWDRDATYLLMDAGPFGAGHQHEDKLHFVLWAHGRQLVLDPGNYSYDASRWRRYVIGTAAHNTVMVDGQGQNRRGIKATYVWLLPWTAPAPAASDTCWVSTPEYDSAVGFYRDGYGPKHEPVIHRRQIVFVKAENLFLVSDLLTPRDKAAHRYDALFHLDAKTAAANPAAQTVRMGDPGQAGLAIVAAKGDGLSVEMVQGKTDEPVQGWSSGPWRAIPTAIYSRSGTGPVRFDFVLCPIAAGASPAAVSVERTGNVVRIGLAHGQWLEVQPADEKADVVVKRMK